MSHTNCCTLQSYDPTTHVHGVHDIYRILWTRWWRSLDQLIRSLSGETDFLHRFFSDVPLYSLLPFLCTMHVHSMHVLFKFFKYKYSFGSLKKTYLCQPYIGLHFFSTNLRCIKPNSKQVPQTFDRDLVAKQLSYNGALQITKIRQAGYPVRIHFREFADR